MAVTLPFLWLFLGGALVVAASFLAGRLVHLLSVRQEHRKELVSQVVKPWLLEARRVEGYLSGPGLANYVRPDEQGQGYTFRRAYLGITIDFPPNRPMWDRAGEHWAGHVARWATAQKALSALDAQVDGLVKEVEAALPKPPGAAQWHHERPGHPGFGARFAATALWSKHWEGSLHSQSEFEAAVRQSTWWKPDHPDKSGLLAAAVGVLFSESGQRRLAAIHREADRLRRELDDFETVLQELSYDRNLRGTCTYCPEFRMKPTAGPRQATS